MKTTFTLVLGALVVAASVTALARVLLEMQQSLAYGAALP